MSTGLTEGAGTTLTIFPEGQDDKGPPYDDLRWSRFKNFELREMMDVVYERVFPFLRALNGS